MVADALQTVVYRFDVESDSIPLGHFIGTAQATQKILDNFSENLFGEKGQFELYIIAPEPGSFKQIFRIVLGKKGQANSAFGLERALTIMFLIVGTAGAAMNAMDTEFGTGFVAELTGHEPRRLGRFLAGGTLDEDGRAISDDRSERLFIDTNNNIIVTSDDAAERLFINTDGKIIAISDGGAERTVGLAESAEFVTTIMGNITTRFMETEVNDLEERGFGKKEFREAYSGKNQMYKACESNRDVRGIGFGESREFPIKRADFKRHIVADLPDKEGSLDELHEEREVKTVTIDVNSPNWGRVGRGWQGIVEEWQGTAEEKPISFRVDDDDFWRRVIRNDIDLVVGDRMKVQLAYVEVVGNIPVEIENSFGEIEKTFAVMEKTYVEAKSAPKRSKYKVVKVLSFNGQKISDPLDKELILAHWDNDPHTGKADEPGLFDEHP